MPQTPLFERSLDPGGSVIHPRGHAADRAQNPRSARTSPRARGRCRQRRGRRRTARQAEATMRRRAPAGGRERTTTPTPLAGVDRSLRAAAGGWPFAPGLADGLSVRRTECHARHSECCGGDGGRWRDRGDLALSLPAGLTRGRSVRLACGELPARVGAGGWRQSGIGANAHLCRNLELYFRVERKTTYIGKIRQVGTLTVTLPDWHAFSRVRGRGEVSRSLWMSFPRCCAGVRVKALICLGVDCTM